MQSEKITQFDEDVRCAFVMLSEYEFEIEELLYLVKISFFQRYIDLLHYKDEN